MQISGKVIHGDGYGKKLGFPTANLSYDSSVAINHGVWVGRAMVDRADSRAATYDAAVIVGSDFGSMRPPKLEVHLLDFDGDLYGTLLTVELLHFVRPLLRFGNEEKLKQKIAEDIIFIRDYVHRHHN